jgi:hypothetical protein
LRLSLKFTKKASSNFKNTEYEIHPNLDRLKRVF